MDLTELECSYCRGKLYIDFDKYYGGIPQHVSICSHCKRQGLVPDNETIRQFNPKNIQMQQQMIQNVSQEIKNDYVIPQGEILPQPITPEDNSNALESKINEEKESFELKKEDFLAEMSKIIKTIFEETYLSNIENFIEKPEKIIQQEIPINNFEIEDIKKCIDEAFEDHKETKIEKTDIENEKTDTRNEITQEELSQGLENFTKLNTHDKMRAIYILLMENKHNINYEGDLKWRSKK